MQTKQETGSYWHLGQQPQGQLENIVPNWQRIQAAFGFESTDFGARLKAKASTKLPTCIHS